jgi:hypothetical protein
LKALDIIDGSAVPNNVGLYIVGCYDDRITLFSQQARALNLVWALNDQHHLSNFTRIAVVGGGAAGVTTAAAVALASSDAVSVDLDEYRDQLLDLQSESSRRSLDPHIYDWPSQGATLTNADLPILDWTAAPVRDVRASLIRDFTNVRNAVGERLQVKTGHRVTSLVRNASGYLLGYQGFDAVLESSQYEAVFLAFGFGNEPQVADGFQTESYWSDAGIPQNDLSGDASPSFLISGNGDGGLIDLVAAATRSFDHAAMIRTISGYTGVAELGPTLLNIDVQANQSRGAGGSFNLLEAYDHQILAKLNEIGVLNKIKEKLRPRVRLFLHTHQPDLFHVKTSVLNRLAAYLVVKACNGDGRGFRHLVAPTLQNVVAEDGEAQSKRWFLYEGERIGVNKVFIRRGPDRDGVRFPFGSLISEYPSEHIRWIEKHGKSVLVPRVEGSTRTFFKGLAQKFHLPRPQYLEELYPSVDVSLQVEIQGTQATWAGDIIPSDVGQVWNENPPEVKLYCRNSPEQMGALTTAVGRMAIHANRLIVFGNKPLWDTYFAKHTKQSDTANGVPTPKIVTIGSIGTQHNLQSLTIEHLTNTLNAKMDLWVLENLNDTLTGYLDTGDDPHHAIDFEIDRDFRSEMKATWLEWYRLLTAGQDKLSRYLRLIVCAEEHQASANGLAGLLVGPLRMNQILRTTAAALAVATIWQKTSPKDVVPGNLLRSRQLQESSSGFACAADRIAGQAILNACATFEWATDFVLLPLQTASLIVEEFAQSAFDRTDSDSPTMTQVSVPSRIMLSADREFVNALKQGRSALEALLGKKESQLFSRLVRPIERRP